jgi:DNA mismatch repair protein MutS2
MPAEALKARRETFAARALDLGEVLHILERHVKTPLGRRAVRDLVPLDYGEARAALARAAETIQRSRTGALPNLAGLVDPLPALDHARTAGRALEDESFASLRAHIEAQERVVDWLQEMERELPACAELARGMPDLAGLRERLEASLDERGRVRDEASPLLWKLRKEAGEHSRRIDGAVRALLARPGVKSALSDPGPVRRGGRTVLAVKTGSASKVPGIVHDRSNTGETLFVEPREIVLPGNRLAEIHAEERREVERILLELTRAVIDERPQIADACARLARLELALVAASWAAEVGARVPLLPGEEGAARGLLLRSARHPLLLEQARLERLPEVVPIDLRLSGDFDVLVITGPNTGGKTLALKTAGLAALLVRCGMPFPCAQGSTVPLYDGIVADIGDEQEISQSLSTFSSHLARVKDGIGRATEKTLVLLDELGAGTDPDEGAALSEAVLELFLERGSPTLATTHIGKLKEFAFRHARAENACAEFDPVTLAPRYRLLVGTPGESGALHVARRMGLPERIVERAEERLQRRDAELQELMAEVRVARTHAERVRSEAEERLEGVSRASREVEEARAALERRGDLLEAEAQRGIEERVREARRELEAARALIDQMPPAQRTAMGEALGRIDAELSGAALSERRATFLAGLKKGSWVYLPRYRQRVHVLKVDRGEREVTVQVGGMRMKVSFDELESRESR